jgi:hypothetical protein
MKGHAPGCPGKGYCLCDVPRLWRGLRISLAGAALQAIVHVLSGGSVSVRALLLHGAADGGGYALNIHAARRSVAVPGSGPVWDRAIAWINAVVLFAFAYHIGAEAIERLVAQDAELRGWWLILGGLAMTAMNLWQHVVVGKGEAHIRNIALNIHNLGDIAEGLVVAAAGAAIMATENQVFDLWGSAALTAWFLVLGAWVILGHGHNHGPCHDHDSHPR